MLDLVLTKALVVDGTGRAPFRGSIGVDGDRIAWVRPGDAGDSTPQAARTVDAAGRALAPGFIDVHNHSDLGPLVDARMPSTVAQGVTTVVVGNCGLSPWPAAGAPECAELVGGDASAMDLAWDGFGDFLQAVGASRPAANVAALVGHGAVRLEVLGRARRALDPSELTAMRSLVARAMDEGAFGLSSGLIYVPGIHAETDEVVSLAQEVAQRGGLYASHIRGEGEHLFAALDECIEIGRRAGLPTHVSHLKCEGSFVWGRAAEALERVHAAGATADQYPYEAWNSALWSLLPPWAPVEQVAAIAQSEPERLRSAVEIGEPGFQSSVRGVGWEAIVIERTADAAWNGRSVAAIAAALGIEPFDAFIALLEAEPETSCIGHAMHPDDVRGILADPDVMVASDASSMSPDGPFAGVPVHPRNYGTFPRALAAVRDGVLPLEAMVRSMTSLPAERFGLRDRGRIAEGAFADLVLFDPETVEDRATFETPHAYPTGIDLVLVNGAVTVEGRVHTRAGAGRILRRGSA